MSYLHHVLDLFGAFCAGSLVTLGVMARLWYLDQVANPETPRILHPSDAGRGD